MIIFESFVFFCFGRGLAMRVKPVNENPNQIYKRVKSAVKTWPAMEEYAREWQNFFCISNTKMNVCPKHPAVRGANCLVDVEVAAKIADRIFEGKLKFKDLMKLSESAIKAEKDAITVMKFNSFFTYDKRKHSKIICNHKLKVVIVCHYRYIYSAKIV